MNQDLEEVLSINESDSIEDIIRKMETLKDYLKNNNRNSLVPFLDAYLRITQDVKKKSDTGEFNNPEALEELDKEFAELYFNPMKKYLIDGEKTEPWENYLRYTEKNNSMPLMELLLGINAHINADLATALHRTGYSEKEDFEKVNDILEDNLSPVLKNLALTRMDFASLGVFGFRPFAWKGLEKITRWRSLTWENAKKSDFSVEEVRRKTEVNAERMFELAHRKDFKGILRKPGQYLSSEVEIDAV